MTSRIFPRLPPEVCSIVLRFVDLLCPVALLRVSTVACRESLHLLLPRLMYLEPGDVKEIFGVSIMYVMPLFQPISKYFRMRMKYHFSLNLSRYTYTHPASRCAVVITYGKRREGFVCRLDAIYTCGGVTREMLYESIKGELGGSPGRNLSLASRHSAMSSFLAPSK
jgi:hypothetical protein